MIFNGWFCSKKNNNQIKELTKKDNEQYLSNIIIINNLDILIKVICELATIYLWDQMLA